MSKSKLEEYAYLQLKKEYPHLKILQNKRPFWLRYKDGTRLELDFYIPYLEIAIEIQGKQHYEYTPYFHKSIKDFERQQKYDKYKKFICSNQGIKLFEASSKK